MEAGEGLPFDVMAYHSGKLIRIQTKSTQGPRSGSRYSFITARGRYANKNSHAVSLTTYTRAEVDLIACAALSIDKVLFVPVTKVITDRLNIDVTEFVKTDAAKESFIEGLKELKIIWAS